MITFDPKYANVLSVKAGGSLILPVNVSGMPDPTIKWYHKDIPLHESAKVNIESDVSYSTLTVKGTAAEDAGRYRVAAQNMVGSDNAEFNVKVKSVYLIKFSR